MDTKEKRMEIYTYIRQNIGKVADKDMQTIKAYLNEYAKIKNDNLLKEVELLKTAKSKYNKRLNDIRSKKQMGYFNYDFIDR